MKNIKIFSFIVLLLLSAVEGLLGSSAGADSTPTIEQQILTLCKQDKQDLLISACFRRDDRCQRLLHQKVDRNILPKYEIIVKTLLDAGVDPNSQETYFRTTPLMGATSMGLVNIVRMLLAAGADPNVICELEGCNTPLMFACNHVFTSIVKELLAAGADPYIENRAGLTAFNFYKGRCFGDVLTDLLLLNVMFTKHSALFFKQEFQDFIHAILNSPRIRNPKNDQEVQEAFLFKKGISQIRSAFNALKDDVKVATKLPLYSSMLVQAYEDFLNGNTDDLYHQLILMPRLIRQKNKFLCGAIKTSFLDNNPFKKESLKPLLFFLCKTKGDREFVENCILPKP